MPAHTRAGQKAKGNRAVEEVRALLLRHLRMLSEADIYKPVGTMPGPDLHLSPKAQIVFPFVVEVKNQERLQIWAALNQAESHAKKIGGLKKAPILFFRRNRSKLYVAMEADVFMQYW